MYNNQAECLSYLSQPR